MSELRKEEILEDALRMLHANWNRLKTEVIPGSDWNVQVRQEDHWFVLTGWVDSFGTKGRLLSAVPEIEGARWIVDRIRVGFTGVTGQRLRFASPVSDEDGQQELRAYS